MTDHLPLPQKQRTSDDLRSAAYRRHTGAPGQHEGGQGSHAAREEGAKRSPSAEDTEGPTGRYQNEQVVWQGDRVHGQHVKTNCISTNQEEFAMRNKSQNLDVTQ